MPSHVLLTTCGLLVFLALLLLIAGTMGVAQAQVTPYPVTLTMSGPATAISGQEITYRLRYQLTDPSTLSRTAIVISFSQRATFVSTQVISGTPGVLRPHSENFFRWSDLGNSTQTEGEIEMVVRIDADFRGSVFSGARVPGTMTTSSNTVETQVFAPGMLPEAGGGGPVGGSGSPVAAGLLALVGAALLGAAASIRLMRRFG